MLEGIVPVAFGEVGVDEHCADFVEQSTVHALSYSVVLWRVGCSELVLDSFVFEIAGEGGRRVFPPAVRAEGFDALASLELDSGKVLECLEGVRLGS